MSRLYHKPLCLALILLAFATGLMAQPQQSENFRITKSVLDAGGGASSSANFNLVSAFGQPTPVGVQSSANFVLYAGFLTPDFGPGVLNSIDSLVIMRQAGLSANMQLDWKAIAGATQYKVYRDTFATFAPTPATLIGTSATTQFVDVGAVSLPLPLKRYYIVTAADAAGLVLTPPNQVVIGNGSSSAEIPAIVQPVSISPDVAPQAPPKGKNKK